VNLAARLESSADPGKILITRETWSLVKDAVIAKEMPPLTVKGIGHPVQVYELLGVKDSMPTKVIRRNIDGMQITIELGRGDKKQTVQVLKELIAEIDFERKAI
jgi:adenylate cyclase